MPIDLQKIYRSSAIIFKWRLYRVHASKENNYIVFKEIIKGRYTAKVICTIEFIV